MNHALGVSIRHGLADLLKHLQEARPVLLRAGALPTRLLIVAAGAGPTAACVFHGEP